MFCPNCGSAMREGAMFCASCGHQISTTQQPAVPAPAPVDAVNDATVLSSHTPTTPAQAGVPTTPTPVPPAAGQPTGAIPMPQVPLPQTAAPTTPAGPIPSTAQPAATANPAQPAAAPDAQPAAAAPSNPAAPTATASPMVKELVSQGNMQAIGASIGIGVIAAIVLSILPAIALNSLGSSLNFGSSDLSSAFDDNIFSLTNGMNFFHYLVFSLVIGLGGASHTNPSASPSDSIDLFSSGSSNLIAYPLGLTGVVLVIGAAYGAYMVARTKGIRFKFAGLVSGFISGLISALVITLIAAIGQAPIVDGTTIRAHLTGATWRTFLMTFLLGTIGSLVGYALAQYASDSKTVFRAFWQWSHRTRGFVRSTTEVLFLQLALFLVAAIVGLFAMTFHVNQGLLLLMFPITLLMIGEFVFTWATLGAMSLTQGADQLPQTASLFSTNLDMTVWPIWLLFVLFLAITCWTALRASARNMYDSAYMGWQHIWKMPVAVMIFWLLSNVLFGTIGNASSSDTTTIGPAMWDFLIMGIWAVLIEIVAMTFGPTIVVSAPALWPILVGGTVRATPQPVVDYIYASGAMFGKWPTWGTPSEGVTARPFDGGPNPSATPGGPANGPAGGPGDGLVPPAGTAGAAPVPSPDAAPAAVTTPGTAAFTAAPVTAPSAIPAAPAASPAALGVPGAVPAATATAMTAQQKRTAIIAGAVVGFLVLFGVVYAVLSSALFSAKSVANSYVAAIASGDFDKANDIAKPAVDQDKAALLTDKASEGENTRISNARITQTTTNADGSVTAQLSYTLGGKEITSDSIKMVTNGGKFLIFKNWTVAEPLVKTIKVSMPDLLDSVVVNGVTVSAKNSISGSDDSSSYSYLEFPVYPGTYKVTAPKSEYYSSSTVSASTNADSSDTLKLTSTDKLKSAIDKEVKSATDKCAASTEAEPEGCPFGYSSYYSTSRYRNFKWKVKNYATVDDIDMSSSTFSTKEGDVTMNYEYHSSDGWEPDDGSRSFTANGHFTIADGKVSISFAN